MTTPLSIEELAGGKPVATFVGKDHRATVSFFVGSFAPGRGPKLHTHPYDETFILEEGRATFTVDGETVEAEGGEIVVVPARTPHKFVVTGDRDMRSVNIHAAPEMSTDWLEE